jgi:hypothetical protein
MDGNTSQNTSVLPDFIDFDIIIFHVAKLSFGYGHSRFYLGNVFLKLMNLYSAYALLAKEGYDVIKRIKAVRLRIALCNEISRIS